MSGLRDYLDTITARTEKGVLCIAIGEGPYWADNGRYSHKKFREVFLQWPEEADKAISGIATWAPKADVWVCTHLLNKGHRSKGNSVNRMHIHVDIDNGRLDIAKVQALNGFAVGSGTPGNGHVYVELTESVPVHHYQVLCRALADHLGGGDAKIADNDVLRPPGTYNLKEWARGGDPTPVDWLVRPSGVRHEPDALAALLGVTLGDPPGSAGTSSKSGNTKSTGTEDDTAGDISPQPVDLAEYPQLAEWANSTRSVFKDDGRTVDRSKTIYAIIAEAQRSGLTINQAVWVVQQRADLVEKLTNADAHRAWEKIRDGGTDFDAGDGEPAGNGNGSKPNPELAAGHRKRAHSLASRYVDKLMHVHGLGWYHSDGKRWLEDRTGHAERAVMHILDTEMRAALRMPDGTPERKAAIVAIASASSANGIASILTVASKLSEFAYTVDDLDAAPHLLNTPTATINLDTMTAQRHDPGDRITKITSGCYSHSALTESRWATFIAEVLPDLDVRHYLQKLVGAALFGEVVHDVLVILNGEGRNGKSALIEAVVHALDDYGVTTAPDLLMERHHAAHPTELMNLRGARLAVAAETQKGRRLDAEKMKRLTGGDTITARKIARDEVSWRPTHTLLLATNHLPVVDSTSVAVWERLRVIPFTQTFTEGSGRQDAGLRARLRGEPDAVLTWAVDGWKAYVEDGRRLTPIPAAVRAALDQYRADSDPVGTAVAQFVDDCCAVSPANKIATRELFEKGYEIWRREIAEDAPAVEITEFGKALNDAGYTAKRGRGGVRMRQGITLNPQEMWDTDGTGDGW